MISENKIRIVVLYQIHKKLNVAVSTFNLTLNTRSNSLDFFLVMNGLGPFMNTILSNMGLNYFEQITTC